MFAAVDIGGTKTLVAVFDKHGKILEQIKFPTPENYDDFKIELAKTVANLSTKDFRLAVVAIPGKIDRIRGIAISLGNLAWKNINIQADAEEIFHAPTLLENDAKLGGLSEALVLENKYQKVLYVTISTGIGLGLTIDGYIDVNLGDGGGRNMMLEHNGKIMPWEEFGSGKAIVKKYGERASDINDIDTWKRIVKDFAVGIIDLIAVLNPDVIVIGGGVGSHFDKFGALLIERLKIYETPLLPIPPILAAKHPEEAVIYGCYEFAKQHHEKLTT